MRRRGMRYPERSLVMSGMVTLGGALILAIGIADLGAVDHTAEDIAARIIIGLLILGLGTGCVYYFLWACTRFSALRTGHGVIARWTVSMPDFIAFCAIDRHFADGVANVYRPPRQTPAFGVEVIFAEDGLLIGDCYFPLIQNGRSRFTHVHWINGHPAILEFSTAATADCGTRPACTLPAVASLRVPIAPSAARRAQRVAAHYRTLMAQLPHSPQSRR